MPYLILAAASLALAACAQPTQDQARAIYILAGQQLAAHSAWSAQIQAGAFASALGAYRIGH